MRGEREGFDPSGVLFKHTKTYEVSLGREDWARDAEFDGERSGQLCRVVTEGRKEEDEERVNREQRGERRGEERRGRESKS